MKTSVQLCVLCFSVVKFRGKHEGMENTKKHGVKT